MANSTLDTILPELLKPKEAARFLGMAERMLWRHSRSGTAPAPLRIGGLSRYRRSELLEWLADGCPRIDGGPQP